ncbi:DNA-binding protein [Celeribacter persicus]|uniref:DNA-binding protein n=2 Tax=Celeribacter persicus TaxID=1651082 RepID=A0A2T5HBL3_9RHOB|nr:DNA-binding protein [Celeribacter persicus]
MASRTTASRKTKTTPKSGAKTAPVSKKTEGKTVKKTVPVSTEPAPVKPPETTVVATMKKKEFIDRVAEASGVKRGEARKAVEAALKELGDALQRGEELNLPPLGKMTVKRQQDGGGAYVIVARLRRSKTMLGEEVEGGKTAQEAPETVTEEI